MAPNSNRPGDNADRDENSFVAEWPPCYSYQVQKIRTSFGYDELNCFSHQLDSLKSSFRNNFKLSSCIDSIFSPTFPHKRSIKKILRLWWNENWPTICTNKTRNRDGIRMLKTGAERQGMQKTNQTLTARSRPNRFLNVKKRVPSYFCANIARSNFAQSFGLDFDSKFLKVFLRSNCHTMKFHLIDRIIAS